MVINLIIIIINDLIYSFNVSDRNIEIYVIPYIGFSIILYEIVPIIAILGLLLTIYISREKSQKNEIFRLYGTLIYVLNEYSRGQIIFEKFILILLLLLGFSSWLPKITEKLFHEFLCSQSNISYYRIAGINLYAIFIKMGFLCIYAIALIKRRGLFFRIFFNFIFLILLPYIFYISGHEMYITVFYLFVFFFYKISLVLYIQVIRSADKMLELLCLIGKRNSQNSFIEMLYLITNYEEKESLYLKIYLNELLNFLDLKKKALACWTEHIRNTSFIESPRNLLARYLMEIETQGIFPFSLSGFAEAYEKEISLKKFDLYLANLAEVTYELSEYWKEKKIQFSFFHSFESNYLSLGIVTTNPMLMNLIITPVV